MDESEGPLIRRIVVAICRGGVDSSVAAYLLAKEGCLLASGVSMQVLGLPQK